MVKGESLETRCLLATITVTSLADNLDVDGQVTLREAIDAANQDISVDGSTAGSGADVIDFDPSLFAGGPARIPLSLGIATSRGPAHLEVTSALTINGPGQNQLTIERDVAGLFRLFVVQAGSGNPVVISDVTLSNGATDSAEGGGAIRAASPLTIQNSTLSGNTSQTDGGAVAGGPLTVTNSTISGNSAGDNGGAFYTYHGSITVRDSTITGNTADNGGGGIYNYSGTLRVENSVLSGNTARIGGAVGQMYGSTIITDSTLSGNTGDHAGAARNSYGGLTLRNTTVSGNSATAGSAGGVGTQGGPTLIYNSTFVGNSATANGGAIGEFGLVGRATIVNSTITGNSAGNTGGGVYVFRNALFNNSIVAGNTAPAAPDLVQMPAATVTTNSSIIGSTDPLLIFEDENSDGQVTIDDLRNNGGPTLTLALTPGSMASPNPAIDSGNNSLAEDNSGVPFDFDQRGDGFPRIINGTVDLGAFESSASVFSTAGVLANGILFIRVTGDDVLLPHDIDLSVDAGSSELVVTIIVDTNPVPFMRVQRFPLAQVNQVVANLSGSSDELVAGVGVPPLLAFGGGGNDLIVSNSGRNDSLNGGDGNDSLFGGGGRDKVQGGDGDDLVHGGGSTDTLGGGTGSDIIQGRGQNFLLENVPAGIDNRNLDLTDNGLAARGAAGEDSIPAVIVGALLQGNVHNNVLDASRWTRSPVSIFGANGRDTLIGSANGDLLNGGNENDRLLGLAGDDTLDGDAGDDVLLGHGGGDVLLGGDGNDQVHGSRGRDTLSGGLGDDLLTGANGSILQESTIRASRLTLDDSGFVGYGTDDVQTFVRGILLFGNEFDNEINASAYTGLEQVTILGMGGDDVLFGGRAPARLEGGDGNDVLVGQKQSDTLLGQAGDDILNGGAGNDALFGGTGNDDLRGHSQRDLLLGEDGNDTLDGGFYSDTLLGGDGNDDLDGRHNADFLIGGNGDDTLDGSLGLDRFHSAPGNDTVHLNSPPETDEAFTVDINQILAGLR